MDASAALKSANNIIFAASFVICRVYLTASSVLIAMSLYSSGCWAVFSLVDFLVVYCCGLYVALTGFWTYGIMSKAVALVLGGKTPRREKKVE